MSAVTKQVKKYRNRLKIRNSENFASADIVGVSGEIEGMKYGLKLYASGEESAKQQATSVFERFAKYKAKGGKDDLEKYLTDRNFTEIDAILNDPIYSGQVRIITSDQLEPATAWLKRMIATESARRPEQVERYSDTLKMLESKINDNADEYIISDIETDADKLQILGKERETFIKARVNQSVFRERLLNKYDCCCLCKVSNPKFLIASHIKPWADSENDEKLDADNGLLLYPNHDALFDSGYISFDENGVIIISEQLGQVDAIFMNVDKNMKINLSSKNKKYLEYHRNKIFKK